MAAWNNSTFSAAEACKRLHFYTSVQRLRHSRPEALPGATDRDEGTLWHAVMAQHYGVGLPGFTADSRGPLAPVDDWTAKAEAAAEFDEDVEAIRARADWWAAMYDAYDKRYVDDRARWEVLAVEQRFVTVLGDECPSCATEYAEGMRKGTLLIPFCNCGAEVDYLVGQADLIVREDGVLRVVDHKTTKRSVGEWKLASYTEDPQFTHYLYGVSRVTGEWVGAATANLVAKLKLVDERGNPFHRNTEIIRGPEDFAAFVAERRAAIADIRSRRVLNRLNPSPGMWPRSPGSCRRFGLCDFYGACWPTRRDWWTIPEDIADSFTEKPLNYVDDYDKLIEEDVR